MMGFFDWLGPPKKKRRKKPVKVAMAELTFYSVQLRVPGSPWVWVAPTGSGTTTDPDGAYKFGDRDAAEKLARKLTGPQSSIQTRVVKR